MGIPFTQEEIEHAKEVSELALPTTNLVSPLIIRLYDVHETVDHDRYIDLPGKK